MIAENVHDTTQAEMARLRVELGGAGRSLSPSSLPMVHFWFLGSVDVHEVAGGIPTCIDPNDLAFLMPRMEDVADAILTIVPPDDILHGPSLDH